MVPLNKLLLQVVIFFTVIGLFSCQEKIFTGNVNCTDCYSNKPDSVDLKLHITLKNNKERVPVLLFHGNIDSGQFIDTFFCNEDPFFVYVAANNEYAAKAIYKLTDRTIYAVDGTKQKLQRVSSQCDTTCWVIEGVDLNLKIAF
jgi:hypothetical protein